MKPFIKSFLFLVVVGLLAVGGYFVFNLNFDSSVLELKAQNLENMGVIYRSNELNSMTKMAESELAQEIKTALAENPKTSILNLTVTASGSRITLSGKAENHEQIQNAIKTTLETPGVMEVISTIIIDPNIQVAGKGALL